MMNLFKKKKILVTHGGGFHADDLFATSALYLLHKGEVKIQRIKRGVSVNEADYVYDIGGIYDPDNNRFDHHQKGAPVREDGIPYSSFGLIWKHYGSLICGGDEAVAKRIDKRIVVPIDADDNGIQIYKPVFDGYKPYQLSDYLMAENPTWLENNQNTDKIFNDLVKKAAKILKREITVARDDIVAEKIIKEAYEGAQDKRVIFLEQSLPRYLYQDVLSSFKEPLFVIMPTTDKKWKAEAIKKDNFSLESRKLFPVNWRGVLDQNELEKLTGTKGVIFCHTSGFVSFCLTKEGVVNLVQKTIEE